MGEKYFPSIILMNQLIDGQLGVKEALWQRAVVLKIECAELSLGEFKGRFWLNKSKNLDLAFVSVFRVMPQLLQITHRVARLKEKLLDRMLEVLGGLSCGFGTNSLDVKMRIIILSCSLMECDY